MLLRQSLPLSLFMALCETLLILIVKSVRCISCTCNRIQHKYDINSDNNKEKKSGWSFLSIAVKTVTFWSRGTQYTRAREWVRTCVRASAADKRGEASQEVSGSPCQAASCSVSAPQTRRTPVSHVSAHTKRTMRLLTVSTLLLFFFFSSGMDTQLLSLNTSRD